MYELNEVEVPFLILVRVQQPGSMLVCSGAALFPKMALTAAMCLFAGTVLIEPNQIEMCQSSSNCIRSSKIILYPTKTVPMDTVALLKTDNSAFSSYFEKWDGGTTLTDCYLYTYGETQSTQIGDKKNQVKLNDTNCKAEYTVDGGICFIVDREHQTCVGDTGAPLVCQGSLVAVFRAPFSETDPTPNPQCGGIQPPINLLFYPVSVLKSWIKKNAASKTTWTHFPSLASWCGVTFAFLYPFF